jgi:hypothetical protein
MESNRPEMASSIYWGAEQLIPMAIILSPCDQEQEGLSVR